MPVQRIHNFSLAWLLSVLAGMLLTLVVLAGVLFWRLTEGRMTGHSVTQAMSNALSIPEQGVAVKVGAAKLSWEGWQSPLGVRMFELDVMTPQGQISLPEMAIGLNLTRLFRGDVAPSLIRLEQPSLQWTLGQTDVSGIDFSGWLETSAQSSGGAAIPPHLQYLKRIILNNADLRILDEARDRVIRVVQVNVSAKRTLREVNVKVAGKVQQEKQSIPVQVDAQWHLQEQSGTGKLMLGTAPWTWVTQWLPENAWTQRLDAPISGTVRVEVGGNLQPTRLEAAVSLGVGTVDLGEEGLRRFSGAKLEAAWDGKADTLEVRAFQATFISGLEVKAHGQLQQLQITPHGQVELEVKRLGLVHELNELLKTRMPSLQVSARGPQNEQRIGAVDATVLFSPPSSPTGLPEVGEVVGTVSVSDARVGLQHTAYPGISVLVADADGKVEFKLGPDFVLQDAKTQFKFSGANVLMEGGGEPLEIEKLTFSADWDGITLQTKDFRVKLDNTTRLDAQAKLRTHKFMPVELSLQANAFNVPVDDLSNWWLPNLAPRTREWVVNRMSKGQVHEASVDLQMSSKESPNAGPLRLRHLKSTLHVADTSVRYYKNLPESRRVNATVEIGADAVEIAIHSGVINELEIKAGTLRFSPLQSGLPLAQFSFDATGPLPTALALLEHPDLAVLEKGVLPFSQASGQVQLDLGMDFPLKDELADGDFQFSADARIDNVSLLGLPLDLDLAHGTLNVAASPKAVLIAGTGQVHGAEIGLEFSKTEGGYPATRIHLPTSAEVAGLVRRIIGFELEGQASGRVEITQQNQETSLVAVQVGLAPTGFVVPVVGWAKKIGSPGTAKVMALMTKHGFSPYLRVELETEALSARGRMEFGQLGGFKSLQLLELHGPGTELDLLEIASRPNGYSVKLQGPQLDLSPLLEDAGATEFAGEIAFDLTSEHIVLSEKLLLFGKTVGTVSAAGKLEAKHHGGIGYGGRPVWADGTIKVEKSGKLPRVVGQGKSEAGDTHFLFEPQTDPPHVLEVESNDAGSVLYLLTDTQAFKGGKLNLRTEFFDDNLTRHESEVRLSNFTVTDAPLLVDILSLVSLTGLLEQLLAGGVFFDEGYSKVSVAEGHYTFTEGSAIGVSTGVVFSGWINPAKHELDLKGSIAPAYVLTRLIRWIPVLGTILTGTDKAGLIALDFRAHGSLDDPEKQANPLSLAPGILREVFRFDWLDNSTAGEP